MTPGLPKADVADGFMHAGQQQGQQEEEDAAAPDAPAAAPVTC